MYSYAILRLHKNNLQIVWHQDLITFLFSLGVALKNRSTNYMQLRCNFGIAIFTYYSLNF